MIGFAICEIAARMLYPAPPDGSREPPVWYERDRELGYFHVPDQVGWIDEGLVTINSLGFRGREPEIPKPPGLFRIVVLGDSSTLGWGVNDDDPYCVQLEKLLRERTPHGSIEVVNCGVSAYAANQEATLFARWGPRLLPDLVLVGFYWNDLLMGPADAKATNSARDESTTIANLVPTSNRLLRLNQPSTFNSLLRHSRAIYLAGRTIKGLQGSGDPYADLEQQLLTGQANPSIDERWGLFEKQLSRIRDLSTTYGFRFGVVVLPSREQVSRDYPEARLQSKVKEIADRLGSFVIDPLPEFRKHRQEVEELFIPYDRHHPTAAGHRVIAQAIADYFANCNLVPHTSSP